MHVRQGSVALGIGLVVLAASACAAESKSPSTPELKPVTLDAASTNSGAIVTYTCADNGLVKGCGPEPIVGKWSKTIQVPAGTIVLVNVSGGGTGNSCVITDSAGKKQAEDTTYGQCSAVIN